MKSTKTTTNNGQAGQKRDNKKTMTKRLYISDYPDSIYKTLWQTNPRYSIGLLNLISIGDRDQETRQAIARQGGTASGKARLKKAFTEQYLIYYLELSHAKDQALNIINEYNGRYKNKIDINDLDSINKYLPIKLLNKIRAIYNRVYRQQTKLKKIAKRYQEKPQ